VVVLEHEGAEYLMSANGNSEWSRNLRASGSGRLTRRGTVERFTAVEVPTSQVPPLMEEYLRQFGNLPTVGRSFRMLPSPADHPTFRITFSGEDH